MPHGFSLRVGDKGPYSLTWTGSLADGETIEDSDWTANPALGLTLSDDDTSGMTTTVVVEAVTAGSYILTNRVEGSLGTVVYDDLLFSVASDETTAYLTENEAELRLWAKYRIEADLNPGLLEAASDELDSLSPFIGSKLDTSGEQVRAFPRSTNPDGTTNEEEDPPEAILDRVVLTAYRLTSGGAARTPGITSESIGNTSRSYSSPKLSEVDTLLEANWNALYPYFLKVGQRVGVSSASITFRTHESYPDWPLG